MESTGSKDPIGMDDDDVDYLELAGQVEDSAFRKSLKLEMEKQRFNECIHEISEFCWEKCLPSADNRLGTRTENCLENCVNRFLDVSKMITNRFSKIINKLNNAPDE